MNAAILTEARSNRRGKERISDSIVRKLGSVRNLGG